MPNKTRARKQSKSDKGAIPEWFEFALCESETYSRIGKGTSHNKWSWVERKYDGIRAGLRWKPDGRVVLFGRRGEDLTLQFPEVVREGERMFDESDGVVGEVGGEQYYGGRLSLADVVLDGEIVTEESIRGDMRDDFLSVVSRSKTKDVFKSSLLAKVCPCVFVVFATVRNDAISGDVLSVYLSQIEECENEGGAIVKVDRFEDVESAWRMAVQHEWEGVVVKEVKYPSGRYPSGRTNAWKKVKRFQEASHTFKSYEVTPSGIVLRDKANDRSVCINGVEADEVRSVVDAKGEVTVDVQYMKQESGAWRFPSFRGVK